MKNQNMKTIDYSYFIERYIAGTMDEAEKKWFEKELDGNSVLQNELKLRRRVDSSLARHDVIELRNKLTAIEKERRDRMIMAKTYSERRTPLIRFAAAIATLLIVGSLYLLLNHGNSPENLYRKNFVAHEYPGEPRSGLFLSNNFKLAMELYKRSDYTGAASLLEKYLGSKPDAMEARLYYGISEMKNNNFPVAESSFKTIIDNSDNLFIDIAQWYLALCYIKTDEKSNALTQLESIINSNSIFRDKAKRLARKIK